MSTLWFCFIMHWLVQVPDKQALEEKADVARMVDRLLESKRGLDWEIQYGDDVVGLDQAAVGGFLQAQRAEAAKGGDEARRRLLAGLLICRRVPSDSYVPVLKAIAESTDLPVNLRAEAIKSLGAVGGALHFSSSSSEARRTCLGRRRSRRCARPATSA